jgi:cell division protein FtsQ
MRNAHVLLLPRARPGRAADVATRAPIIRNQRSRLRRSRQARRWLRPVGRVLLGGLFAAALYVVVSVAVHWFRTTPLLAVTSVEIQGAHRLTEAVIRAAAAIPIGANLLTLDPVAIRSRVEGLTGVERASVVRDLPHRVSLHVQEREPYALVQRKGGGRLLWVDATGYLIGAEPRPGSPALPILSGVEPATAASDADPPDRLRVGLALLRAIERTGARLAGRISEIDLAGPEGPVLYLVDGTEVRVGTEAWDERLARLEGVLGELERTGERVAAVDLRFRDQVVLKPWGVPPGSGTRAAVAGAQRRQSGLGTGPAAPAEHP